MLGEHDFKELILRVRAGSGEAAAELVRLYEPAIRRAARIRLVDSRLRRVFDSMDISQSVFASFFVRAAMGQYDLNQPEQLLKLLVAISRKKLADKVRQERAARRDYRRVREDNHATDKLPAGGSDPGQRLAAEELVQEFRKRLSEEERQLAELRVLGKGWDQIAAERGGSPEALRKRLTRAVERIAQQLGLDEFADD